MLPFSPRTAAAGALKYLRGFCSSRQSFLLSCRVQHLAGCVNRRSGGPGRVRPQQRVRRGQQLRVRPRGIQGPRQQQIWSGGSHVPIPRSHQNMVRAKRTTLVTLPVSTPLTCKQQNYSSGVERSILITPYYEPLLGLRLD